MKKTICIASCLTVAALAPVVALADDAAPAPDTVNPDAAKPDAGPWSLGGSLDITSDYRFRGVSQTYGLPSIQGEFDLKHSAGFYASTAGQNVSGNEYVGGNSEEWDFWGGYAFEVAKDVPLDFGVYEYFYPGSKTPGTLKQYNTTELYADIGYVGVIAKFSYAVSDFFGIPSSNGSWYGDLSYNYDFTKELHLALHVGHQYVKANASPSLSYTDYKVGGSYDALGLNWAGAVIGTNAHKDAYTYANFTYLGAPTGPTRVVSKPTFVVTVTKSF